MYNDLKLASNNKKSTGRKVPVIDFIQNDTL